MKLKKYIAIFCVSGILWGSCKKEKPVEYSTTPQLTFESISPATVTEFQDSITIVVSYVDGDGDLGENNAGVNNLFVIDQRDTTITYPFRVQQLAPDNASIAIRGKLNVVLKNTGITNGSVQQMVTYQVYMFDRAGHQSNTITTTAVTVNK